MIPSMFAVGLDQAFTLHPVRAVLLGCMQGIAVHGRPSKAQLDEANERRAQALAHPYLAQLHDASSEPAAPSAPAAFT